MNTKEEIIKYQNERIKWIISGLEWDSLDEWEQEFIESIEKQSNAGQVLSDETTRNKNGNSQMEIIERIYQKKSR